MSRLGQDLRCAARTLLRGRSVTALAVLAFALGIGVTTAVFSIFNSVLLEPLPYPDAHELVMVFDTQPACATCPASWEKFHDWKDRNQVFDVMGGSMPTPFVLAGKGDPERVVGMATTASLADVFAVRPALGRWYTAQEAQPGGPRVAVLSHAFWTRRFNADRAVIGQGVMLDAEGYEIIGVMPEGFVHRNADLFVPLQRQVNPANRGTHFLATVARLKDGVTAGRAATEMRALGGALAKEFGHNHGIDVKSLHEATVGNVRSPLRVLLGAVFLVLLIACANVANLLLASGLARRRELAVRLALGARTSDLARQLVTEGVLLALCGGMLGVLLAQWAVRTFVGLAGNQLPRGATVAIDLRVLGFTAAVSLGVGVFCGLWPLLRLRARELAAAVREGDMRTGSGGGARFGNGLVIAEIAVAYALLVGAGLMVKNLVQLMDRDTGMRIERIATFDVAPAGPRYRDPRQVAAFYRDLLERLRAAGDVESAGAISHLPMYRFGTNGEMTAEGGNPWGPGQAPLVEYRWVAGEYFRTLGIPLRQGRLFTDRDRQGTPQVVVINQTMAQKFWPGQNAVGKRIASGTSGNWWEVIGVVGDTRSYGLAANSPYEMYRSLEQQPFAAMTVAMRTRGEDPAAAFQAARQIVSAIDPSLPISKPQTMEAVVAASVGQPRLLSSLSGLFGLLAGLLAMVGVYGVTAYNVRRQRREFGIRLALGADPQRVRRLVVARGGLVALAGVVAGAGAALLLTGTLKAMLNDVTATDPYVFAANAALVLLVSAAACYFPARSAGRVDPVVVLRD